MTADVGALRNVPYATVVADAARGENGGVGGVETDGPGRARVTLETCNLVAGWVLEDLDGVIAVGGGVVFTVVAECNADGAADEGDGAVEMDVAAGVEAGEGAALYPGVEGGGDCFQGGKLAVAEEGVTGSGGWTGAAANGGHVGVIFRTGRREMGEVVQLREEWLERRVDLHNEKG